MDSAKRTTDMFSVQFDGKDMYEAFLVTFYDEDGIKKMPLELVKFKKAATGKELEHQLTQLPIDSADIISLTTDTTSVNSGELYKQPLAP